MVCLKVPAAPRRCRRLGYTLIEILVSTLLTLILLMAVVQIFGTVSESIANSRSALEMADELRAAQMRLERDLDGLTVNFLPPRQPESNEGYAEITEGPLGPVIAPEYLREPGAWPRNIEMARTVTAADVDKIPYEVDPTVGDFDDMLMFTTRSAGAPFVGRALVKRSPAPGETKTGDDSAPFVIMTSAESQEAEVAWFVRGRTLYRRVLLIQPNFDADLRTSVREMQLDGRTDSNNPTPSYAPFNPGGVYPGPGFYNFYDISVRNSDDATALMPNALSDLTKPENRFAHRHVHTYPGNKLASGYPFHPHFSADWTGTGTSRFKDVERKVWANLGLPTLRECSFFYPFDPKQPYDSNSWFAGARLPVLPAVQSSDLLGPFDAWLQPHPWRYLDRDTGCLQLAASPPRYMGPRVSEDVVLTNVVGFDVKVWDPAAPLLLLNDSGHTLLPEDRGYLLKLREYLNNPTGGKVTIVSYGAYVDLNYLCHLQDPALPGTAPSAYATVFSGPGVNPALRGTEPHTSANPTPPIRASVYDTWSTHYESDGLDTNGNGLIDEGSDGFDTDGNGVVDDPGEREAPAPYPVPLRGIQIKIRVFEPASRQVREVTVIQDFLPK